MKYQERACVCVRAWTSGETSVYYRSENSMRPNKLRIHLEVPHPSHMHVFFLVELYHLCNKVIIIELFFFSIFEKSTDWWRDVVIHVTNSASIKLNLSKVIALFFWKKWQMSQKVVWKRFFICTSEIPESNVNLMVMCMLCKYTCLTHFIQIIINMTVLLVVRCLRSVPDVQQKLVEIKTWVSTPPWPS